MLPRTFHRIWLGGEEPAWLRPFADSWREHHPDWAFHQWDEEHVQELFPLRNQEIYDRAAEIVPSHVGQLRSDILRYEILCRFGGVYVDADFECLRPIDELIDGVECFAAWEQPGRWVNNAILGAPPRHPFIERLVDGLAANVDARAGSKPNKLSGPQYLTPIFRADGEGVTVFDKALFYPYLWSELHRGGDDFAGAYAVHHWSNRRRERGAPLAAAVTA